MLGYHSALGGRRDVVAFCLCFLGALAPAGARGQAEKSSSVNPGDEVARPAEVGDGNKKESAKSPAEAIRQYRSAVAFQNKETFDLAAEEWQAFLDKHPQDPLAGKARHYLGVCLLQLKQPAEAAQAFEKVLSDDPTFELAPAAWFYQGLAYYQLGQAGQPEGMPKAVAAFTHLIDAHPEAKQVPQALLYRGEALYTQKKLAEAAQSYRKLVKDFPDNPLQQEAMYVLGVALQEVGDFAEAAAIYERYLKAYPAAPLAMEVTMRLGESLQAAGKLEKAGPYLERAARAEGFVFADHALNKLAQWETQRKDFAKAAETYLELRKKFPQSNYASAAQGAAANCLYLAKDYDQAMPIFSELLRQGGSGAPEAAHWLAKIHLEKGEAELALAAAEKGLQTAAGKPYQVELLLDKADAVYEMPDRRVQAATMYEEIAKKFSKDALAPQALYLAAFTSLQTQQYAEADRLTGDFVKQYEKSDLLPAVLYVAAESSLLAKHYDKADKLYESLLRKHAKHTDAPNWRIRRAYAALLNGEFQRVMEQLGSADDSMTPQLQREAQYLMGSAQIELKHYDAALDALQKADGDDVKPIRRAEILAAMARALKAKGDAAAAAQATRKILALAVEAPVKHRARLRLAEFAQTSGNQVEALQEYRQLLAEKDVEPEVRGPALLGAGWCAAGIGELDSAEKLLGELLDSKLSTGMAVKGYFARAALRQKSKDFKGAIEDLDHWNELAGKEANKSDADYLRGLCLTGLGKHEDAARVFASLLEADPGYGGGDKVLYEQAWAYKSAGQAPRAVELFARLVDQKSKSELAGESALHVGESHYDEGKYPEALSWYGKVLEANAEDAHKERALHKMAWTHYQLKDYAAAAKAFEEQVRRFPQSSWSADGRFMQAESHFANQDYSSALPVYETLLKDLPKREDFAAQAVLHAAQCLEQTKQWSQALQAMDRHKELLATSPWADASDYERAWCLQNLGKSDEALKGFQSLGEKSDSEIGARSHFMAGEILFEKKDHREAVRHYFKAAYGYGYPQWQAESLFEAGRCFEVLKNLDQARKCYKELVEKFPNHEKATNASERLRTLAGG